MNTDYDIAVIGAGLLGCFAARRLTEYNWRTAVFERNCDVCTEVSKANTAIIYPGYDPIPGSLKARLNLRAAREFEGLCRALGVAFRRPGSLMVSFGERGNAVLNQKLAQGRENGVEGLRLLSAAELGALEPEINPEARAALFAPGSGTVNPWALGLAGAKNAAANGADFYLGTAIDKIVKTGDGYRLFCGKKSFTARAVVNCAGLCGDEVSELVNKPRFRLSLTKADYLLLDNTAGGHVRHIIMHEPEARGRGATIVPTVDGNLLLGPSRAPAGGRTDFATSAEGCAFVAESCRYVFPRLPLEALIRSFASLRPSIELVSETAEGLAFTGERVHDLAIFETENPGFINLAGIKTPGLTCCDAIGGHVAEMLLDILGNPGKNPEFSGRLESRERFSKLTHSQRARALCEDAAQGEIVCRCRSVTESEIRRSIGGTLGAASLDGVKRRTGALMGRCQGGYCEGRIIEILSQELGVPASEILKDGPDSRILLGRNRSVD